MISSHLMSTYSLSEFLQKIREDAFSSKLFPDCIEMKVYPFALPQPYSRIPIIYFRFFVPTFYPALPEGYQVPFILLLICEDFSLLSYQLKLLLFTLNSYTLLILIKIGIALLNIQNPLLLLVQKLSFHIH